jgi:hypothetical protein
MVFLLEDGKTETREANLIAVRESVSGSKEPVTATVCTALSLCRATAVLWLLKGAYYKAARHTR